ncbi:unnamed protein product [Callosobruchus maculatus]|uniref:MD-2-related lipid-recognition domain-containing protein n=1 Tax=Callosobruchus maculatus TaxID=64391 RepID=A0A653BXW3_CALMS|nr:unnamed protein product [Callosobruchus maculatus]
MLVSDSTIDSTFHVRMTIDQWKNGAWEEKIYNTEGNMCELKDKYAAKAWKKLVAAAEPSVDPEECNAPPGTYTGKKFQAETSDLSIPSMLFGTFRVRFESYNEDNDLFFCTMLELECNRK